MVDAIRALRSSEAELKDLEALAADPSSGAEMAEMAREEADALRARIEVQERDLTLLLLPKDEADAKSAILEVRAGTGGDEAALFAADLFRMYSRYADLHGWKVEVISMSESDLGGFKEVVASITGRNVFARLKFESGVHRVQRVPATEASGRIHTSAATVAVLPEAEEVDVEIRPEDIRIDTMRASGAGGQHVNKTELGGPPDPSADRHRHRVDGEVAASEPAAGDAGAALQALRGGARPRSPANARRRARIKSARAIDRSGYAPTTFRRVVSPITASG